MIDNIKLRREIREYIGKLKSAEDIFGLFKLLNYPDNILFDASYKRKKEEFDFKKEDVQRIKEIYAILSFDEKLPVFLIEAKTLTPSFIRSVTTTFDKQYLHFLLIFSVDYSEVIFVFPKREKVEAGKHKLKLTKLIINKEEIIDKKEHYTVIETLSNIHFEKESTWRDIWRKWNKAFSVERVTEAFFEDYKNIFFTLRKELDKQKIPRKEAHEFTLQFLNRIMFIYFISKKRWIEYPKFVEWLWTSYKKLNKYGSDEFYEKWLRQVFFKAFNNRSNEITGLPEEVKRVISNSPYLNGGLFRENGLDDLKIKITDKLFQKVFDFFEKYNFTIKEDMPLESEVAVDPQMIGYVYESLANVAEEIYDRNDLGIFYTPRVEVDFMCRRAIVEYLSKHLANVPKDKIYHLVFDLPEEKEKIEKWFDKEGLWYKLEEVLDNLSAVDPACGSGAFLVGLLNVLAELYRMVYKHIKRDLTDFELKNKIIQYSLYGVDVMPWAIHAAELRLWLQLIVETEFKKEELRKHPLLPNLNLNLRIGDSLVQEIGGISFNIRTNDLKPHLKKKLDNLKQEKRKYFENSPTAKFKTPEEVKAEEIRLFEEIIDERIESLETDIDVYRKEIKGAKSQRTLTGEYNVDEKKVKQNEASIERNEKEIEKLKRIKELLKDPEKKPFVWDIDFAEVFADKGGFDVVIGNPPYINYKRISPPNKEKKDVTEKDKEEYKNKLIKSIKTLFNVMKTFSRTNDYYIYFYLHGLGLLNSNGTFCFITSNAWLDVDYGKDLQEFLLKYVPITAIYDNPKRSFVHADVNTIIALFGAPKFEEKKTIHGLKIYENGNNWSMLNHIAKFVMFKKPFEEVINTKNLIEIENVKAKIRGNGITELVKNVVKTNDYRVFPILQEDLLEDGWEYPEDYNKKKGKFKTGNYAGNKWGGRFLRAPDIFYTILEKGKKNLIKLEDISYLRTGVKEGGYNKYITHRSRLNKKDFNKYIPILKNVKEHNKITILKNDSFIIKNIRKFKKIAEKRRSPILWLSGRGSTHKCYKNPYGFTFTGNFIGIEPKKDINIDYLVCYLNSTLSILISEIEGRSKGIGGAAAVFSKTDLRKLRVLKKEDVIKDITTIFKKLNLREIKPIFEELGLDPSKPIREQEPKPLPDRAELDKIIFDELGLSKEERKEVYWAVAELVRQRLEKARSLRK